MTDGKEGPISLDVVSFPANGSESEERMVIFGPKSKKFSVLIEVDFEDDNILVLAGNSPTETGDETLSLLSETLIEVGEMLFFQTSTAK